jgi:hypothetical protein
VAKRSIEGLADGSESGLWIYAVWRDGSGFDGSLDLIRWRMIDGC